MKGWSEFRLVSYGKTVESFYRICCSSWHCKSCICASVPDSTSNPLPANVFVLGCTFPKMYLPMDVLFQSTNGRSSHLSWYSPASNPSSVATGDSCTQNHQTSHQGDLIGFIGGKQLVIPLNCHYDRNLDMYTWLSRQRTTCDVAPLTICSIANSLCR